MRACLKIQGQVIQLRGRVPVISDGIFKKNMDFNPYFLSLCQQDSADKFVVRTLTQLARTTYLMFWWNFLNSVCLNQRLLQCRSDRLFFSMFFFSKFIMICLALRLCWQANQYVSFTVTVTQCLRGIKLLFRVQNLRLESAGPGCTLNKIPASYILEVSYLIFLATPAYHKLHDSISNTTER